MNPDTLILISHSLLLLFTTTVQNVNCFNLENRLPIIKYGKTDSYFGYSVAEHSIGEKDDRYTSKWLLVGAPLGKNYQPNTTHSGALFKCPITQLTDDCKQVITDGRRNAGGNYDTDKYAEDNVDQLRPPNDSEEIKDGQWMGVTVRSQGKGGRVLVCAHRYITKESESQWGQGLCYLLSNTLEYEDTHEPCKGRPTGRAHEEYGYCQAGTSGTLLDDDTMILGTPGPITWRGTVFVISFDSDYLNRDKTHYYGPHLDAISPVDKYSYLGMAVAGGRFFNDQMSYASGAPRSSGTGQVVIFSKSIESANPMNVSLIIDGEQFASSFGYELITADVNGDGLPDLLIAAPFYFTRRDGGAVYIYLNADLLNRTYSLRLTGKLESQFGLSLANMGDINKDGCDDIAIGAPYEDQGTVYIYLGTRNGLSDKPSQIIRAQDLGLLSKPLRTFGSSLSGGLDLDNNTYPDLLVGAYGSSAAVALLSRPITNIKTEVRSIELKNIDPSKQGCKDDPGTNLTCFSFEACCSIEPFESTIGKPLDLVYTIEAETFNNNKKFSRAFFGSDFKKRSNIVKRNIRVVTNGIMDCKKEIVYIKENTRDIQSQIQFRLNYTIVESELPDSGLINLNPILDQTQADRRFEASFQKDCGTDDICESQLEVEAALDLKREGGKYKLHLGENDELHLNVTVTNRRDSAYEAQLFVEHQPSVTYIAASKGSVICNQFNSTIVACTIGNPLRRDSFAQVTLRFDPSDLEDSVPTLSFKVFANSTSKQIVMREKTILEVNVIKNAELSIKGWATPEQSFYGGEIKGESAMEYFDDIGSPVQHTYTIFNDGPWRAPVVEVFILWPHQVANDKAQGKWLLYLEERPTIEAAGGGECDIKPEDNVINPLKIKQSPNLVPSEFKIRPFNKTENTEKIRKTNSLLNRVKRDRSMLIRSERLVDKDGKKTDIVHMDCHNNSAKCIKFKCTIYNMQRKTEAYIHVRARLWNATLVADYPQVDVVNIVSRARVKLTNNATIKTANYDDTSVSTRAYPELVIKPGDGSIPIWLIILAVIGGLLVLAIFTFALWKCGFFKRSRPDPLLSANVEKSSENKHLLQNK